MSTELHAIYGSGQVGRLLMHNLNQAGKQVRIVSRSGLSDAPSGVEVKQGDVFDLNFTESVAQGADVLYLCLNQPYNQWENFPLLQANIIKAASKANARLVVLENMYMYGSTKGAPLKETTPYKAPGKKGSIRAKMTEALFAAHARGEVQASSARAADFFGPGVVYGPSADLFQNVLDGKPLQIPFSAKLPHSLTYLPDVAKALEILGGDERALGEAWHIPNPPVRTLEQIATTLGDLTGQPSEVNVIPGAVLEQVAKTDPLMAEMLEVAYFYSEPYIVDHTKFEETFGNIATAWEAALPATLDFYKKN